MDKYYSIIGLTIVWGAALAATILILSGFLWLIVKYVKERGNFLVNVIEYLYHRDEFKEWVKDKERHPKAKI